MLRDLKYQPYHGYGTTQSYWATNNPTRIRTRSDWRPPHEPPYSMHRWHAFRSWYVWEITLCDRCGKVHCDYCRCYRPWTRWPKRSNNSRFEKRDIHRRFRRLAKHAIWDELTSGEPVSHAFRVSGDYLD